MASIGNYLLRLLCGVPLRRKNLAAYDVNYPLVKFSRWPWGDKWRVVDSFAGLGILGVTGSGKTSGSGAYITFAMLTNGFGLLVLTAHPDEVERWLTYCAVTGRSDDVIIFSQHNDSRLNVLNYERKNSGGEVENVVDMFVQAAEVVGRQDGAHRGDRFWMDAMRVMVRQAVSLLLLARDDISLLDIHQVISSAAQNPRVVSESEWQAESYCYAMLQQARAHVAMMDDPMGITQHDLAQVETYWTQEFPGLNDRTKTSIVSVFTSLSDGFMHGSLYQMFCTSTNVDPAWTHHGKIIIVDLPTERYGAYAIIAQALIKYCWQQATRRREVTLSSPATGCYADEAQLFATSSDASFQAIARQKRACTVFLSQSLAGYYHAMGKTATDALLSHLTTRIIHASSGETATWAADCVGKDWHVRKTTTETLPAYNRWKLWPAKAITTNTAEEYNYVVPPIAITQLKTGGKPCRYKVEAILFQVGRRWKKTGKNVLKIQLNQKRLGRYIRTIRMEKGRDIRPLWCAVKIAGKAVWFLVSLLVRILFRLVMWIVRDSRSGRGR